MGEYPTAPLEDGTHGGFTINVTAHLWAPPGGAKGSLTAQGSWGGTTASVTSGEFQAPAGESQVSLQLSATASQIKLWWPTGVGAQPLYNVSATWAPSGPSDNIVASKAVRRVGFRVFALVTINDTDAATVASNASGDGSGSHGMFFRVNGAALYPHWPITPTHCSKKISGILRYDWYFTYTISQYRNECAWLQTLTRTYRSRPPACVCVCDVCVCVQV